MRRGLAVLALLGMLACTLIPSASFTEDRDTVLLARTLYALGKNESFETKLKLGSVVMNRIDSVWFADTLGEVLSDQQQFPSGSRYDDESLRAAHELISGRRALGSEALYYQAQDASAAWDSSDRIAEAGNYSFYAEDGNM